MKQRHDAQLEVASKREGARKAVLKSLKPESAMAAGWEKDNKEAEELHKIQQEEFNEKDISLGLLTTYLPQIDIAAEHDGDEESSIHLDLGTCLELESRQESVWHCLLPKRRREILDDARSALTTCQLPSALAGEAQIEQKVFEN